MTDKLTELGNEAQTAINDAMAQQKAIDNIILAVPAAEVVRAARAVIAATNIEGPLVTNDEFDRRLVALREALRALAEGSGGLGGERPSSRWHRWHEEQTPTGPSSWVCVPLTAPVEADR